MRRAAHRPPRTLVAALVMTLVAAVAAGCSPNPRGSAGVSSPPPLPSGGASWSRLDWQEAGRLTRFGRGARIDALAARDGLVVAVGTTDINAPDGLILLTQDGRGWDRAVDDDLRGVDVADVASTADGFLAVGFEQPGSEAVGVVLASPDGRRWERRATVPGTRLRRVMAGASGFLALGEGAGSQGIVLVSSDARRWDAVPSGVAFGGASVAGIAAVDGSWVGVGSGDGLARAWTSPDGRSWAEASMDGAGPVPGIAAVRVRALTASGTGLMALGTDDPPCEGDPEWCPHFGAAWWSTDGRSWLRLPTDGPLGQWGQRVFAAGDAGFVVFDGSAVLLSKDGYEWAEVPTNGPAPRYLYVDRAVMADDLFVVAGLWIAEEPATLGVGAARVRR